MTNPVPKQWGFLKWLRNDAIVYDSVENYSLSRVQPHMNPFYAAILAAYGPVHEPTEEELALEAKINRILISRRNKGVLQNSLTNVSQTADNPTHWNRLSPEIKSAMQTHYRGILRLRDHANFDGSGRIDEHIPPLPVHDVLEDQDSTPHREFAFLLP